MTDANKSKEPTLETAATSPPIPGTSDKEIGKSSSTVVLPGDAPLPNLASPASSQVLVGSLRIEASSAADSDDGATAAYSGPATTGSVPSAGSFPRTATPLPLAWRSWPVAESVWELLSLTSLIVLTPLVVWGVTGQRAATFGCALAVLFLSARYYVPTQIELNALGVTTRVFGRSRRIPWIAIDRFVIGRRGVFLTSAGAPLEVFRGLYLPWGGHREQILGALRYYLPHAEDGEHL